ncbi:unnamed protein product [Ilex paraguariensis]
MKVHARPSPKAGSRTGQIPPVSGLNPNKLAVCSPKNYGSCIPRISSPRRRCTYENRCKRGPSP